MSSHVVATAIATMEHEISEECLPHRMFAPALFTEKMTESQCRAVSWMVKREHDPGGASVGMQLSECGSGKTRMMLACIAVNRGITVVITAPHLVAQWKVWKAEMIPLLAGSIYILDRTTPADWMCVLSVHAWDRLVIDDVHTVDANFIHSIRQHTDHREPHQFVWLMSGAPSLDMYMMVIPVFFTNVRIRTNRDGGSVWLDLATDDIEVKESMTLSCFLLRVAVCVMGPPRTDLVVTTELVELNRAERSVYQDVLDELSDRLASVRSQSAMLRAHLSRHAFDVVRKRIALGIATYKSDETETSLCIYTDEVEDWLRGKGHGADHIAGVLGEILNVNAGGVECTICMETCPIEDVRVLHCGHHHCRACTRKVKRCPMCRSEIQHGNGVVVTTDCHRPAVGSGSGGRNGRIQTLIADIRDRAPAAVILVLSSYVETVQMVAHGLKTCKTNTPHFEMSGPGMGSFREPLSHLQNNEGDGLVLLATSSMLQGLNIPIFIAYVIIAEPGTDRLTDTLSHVYGGPESDHVVHVNYLVVNDTIEEHFRADDTNL